MIRLNLPTFEMKVSGTKQQPKILDVLRRKYVAITPEEWVRQHFVHYLIEHKGYPASLLANEIQLKCGDKVLRAVAQILKASVKGKDTAARFGGEEFVVLLPDTSIDGAQALAEKLRSTIERSRIRRSDNQQEIAQITVSFGIASYRAGESANDFVSRVDNALYLSKRLGRNRVTLASERQMRFS